MGWDIHVTDLERGEDIRRSFSQPVLRVGRHSEVELVLRHQMLSRVHLTLTADGGRYFAEDSSRNGSFLQVGTEWERLEGRRALQLPATIRLADFSLRIDFQVEQDWDKSVIIPAGHLVKRSEAIMVFDLCESSRIANENDHMAHHLKTRLQQLVEPLMQDYDARFFKGTGDGFLATFSSAAKATRAALEITQRIEQRNARTTNPPIHFRIALHFGDTWEISTGTEDMHGNDLNIAFRIEGVQAESFVEPSATLPRMDRIVCSTALHAEVQRAEESTLAARFTPLGEARLKGIQDPVQLLLVENQS